MDDIVAEFLTETTENLGELDQDLVRLEQTPNDPDLLSKIFRIMHTIKGTCGFLGLPRLEGIAHVAENVLGRFRNHEIEVTPSGISAILQAVDSIKTILTGLAETGSEPVGDDRALIAGLEAAAAGDASAPVSAHATEAELDALMAADTAPATPAIEDEPVETEAAIEAAIEAPILAVSPANDAGTAPAATGSSAAQKSIRVNVDLLENLMTTVSELVLTRNQLLQLQRSQRESGFGSALQRLNQVVSELQDGVMKTRMQPIGGAWGQLPRIIRDLSRDLNKKIVLDMRGAETELDRQVLELIKDPLTHMIRNSADHGIERPEQRVAAGKPETGRIGLNAFHQGGHIIIEISDDGRGLDIERIKAKVLANGLASEAELANLSDHQIQQFIFRAGFSTAEAVTAVSGRGVGMDVVRTNVERIGGTIELQSTRGKGSTFTIKIPLTLAIVSALIVETAGQRYAIPQLSVVELVRICEGTTSAHRIESINGAPVLRLRDRLLPLVGLDEVLRITRSAAAQPNNERFILVTQVGNQAFGIIVDRVFDTEEIVVKPVGRMLRDVAVFSGNTILGDGSVVMIIDPNGIAAQAGDIGMSESKAETDAAAAAAAVAAQDRVSVVLFRAGPGAPKAVALSAVERLEEISPALVEQVGDQAVLQYRDSLMPLVPFGGVYPDPTQRRQPVLVFADQGRCIGLCVEEIIDVVETPMELRLGSREAGIIGSIIVNGKATDFVDVAHYLAAGAACHTALAGKAPLAASDRPFRLQEAA